MWTDSPWCFDTERNSLAVRFWSLLFCPSFQLAGGLVHEANHYRYLECNGMLGKPESVQEEFEKSHRREMEILAREEELEFLERAAPYFPYETTIPMPKHNLVYRRNDIIEKCSASLLAWNEHEDYSEDSDKSNAIIGETNYRVIAQALGVDLPPNRGKGASVRLRFLA